MKRRVALVCGLLLASSAGAADWFVPADFPTIQDAVDSVAVLDGDTIFVSPGNHAGALLDKSVEIRGLGNATIDTGPLHPAGLSQGFRLLAGSDGAVISHLGFQVDLAIMNGDGVDGVTVEHCRFENAIQAVSNWRGNDWSIAHNEISDLRTRCGGGIGILVGDYSGGVVEGNVILHNKVSGVLNVDPDDCGGYNGSGIVLYADFRFGRDGTEEIKNNVVAGNKIALESDTPAVVDVVAIELTDTRDDDSLDPVIFDNAVGFNDLRQTDLQLVLTPDDLDAVNNISRNLGQNRGHGLHPSTLLP